MESADGGSDVFFNRLYDGELLERSLRMEARKSAFRSAAAKTLLIVLGALTATKAVADDIVGAESAGVVLTYAIIGVLVATIAGLLASFKWEERAAQLKVLATQTAATLRELDAMWRSDVSSLARDDPNLGVAREKAITRINAALREHELKAAELGVMAEQPPLAEPTAASPV